MLLTTSNLIKEADILSDIVLAMTAISTVYMLVFSNVDVSVFHQEFYTDIYKTFCYLLLKCTFKFCYLMY